MGCRIQGRWTDRVGIRGRQGGRGSGDLLSVDVGSEGSGLFVAVTGAVGGCWVVDGWNEVNALTGMGRTEILGCLSTRKRGRRIRKGACLDARDKSLCHPNFCLE